MASSSSRFSRRPETRRHSRKSWTPGDPAGGANGGGGADLVSIGSLTTATATGVRWVYVGLRSSTHAFLATAIELLPPSGKVFHVTYRRHPDGRSHRTRPLRRVNQPRPVQLPGVHTYTKFMQERMVYQERPVHQS